MLLLDSLTHASLALQSHDLSGEGISCGSHTYFCDHTRTWRASLDEWSAQCQATSETTWTLKTINTSHSLIHYNKADMRRMVMMAKWYFEKQLIDNIIIADNICEREIYSLKIHLQIASFLFIVWKTQFSQSLLSHMGHSNADLTHGLSNLQASHE